MTRKEAKGQEVRTDEMERLLRFIQAYIDEHSYAPSIREMQRRAKIPAVYKIKTYLDQLEELGYIERQRYIARGLRLVKRLPLPYQSGVRTMRHAGQTLLSIPVAGRIVASKPVPVPASDFSYFDAESTVEVALSMLDLRKGAEEQLYALQVQGDSMVEDMVSDGDIVIMQAAQEAQDGEMVAVWLADQDETTLKRIYREKDRIRLQPANPTMDPIYITEERSMEVQGVVLMIISPLAEQ
jgi:repressor LexA